MVVLATKVYVLGEGRRRAMDSLESLVENELGDLDVEFTVGLRDDGFPSVTVTGEDAPVARNLLESEWGASVRIPADELGLGPGSPAQIRTRFGLVQHVPLRFVEGGEGEPNSLADAERDRLYEWTRGTGRVNANSTTRAQLRATINRSGHADDIVTVERVGLLESSVICREGTDAPGLLADIGPHLEAELLAIVS